MDIMECLCQELLMLENQTLDISQYVCSKAAIVSEHYRIEPEFAFAIGRPNMDMPRLLSFIRIEMKTIRAYA
jgi:hypothetical protein